MNEFGKRIKELRIQRNLTLVELSKIINISVKSLKNYECGEQIPRTKILIIFAKYFNVKTDYLLAIKK